MDQLGVAARLSGRQPTLRPPNQRHDPAQVLPSADECCGPAKPDPGRHSQPKVRQQKQWHSQSINPIHYCRNVWDPNIASCKRMGSSGQHFDIVRLQYKSPCGRAGQEKCTFLARFASSFLLHWHWWMQKFRRWTYAELDVDKICSLVECSIVPREDDGSGKCCWGHVSVYESKFLIVPLCPGHSQLSYISRTDFKFASNSQIPWNAKTPLTLGESHPAGMTESTAKCWPTKCGD
jgi:hypothetical protein